MVVTKQGDANSFENHTLIFVLTDCSFVPSYGLLLV